MCPSAGIHIVLPDYYSPSNMGLLDPATSDGRVIFFLPWQGSTIAGTTDSPTEVTHSPSPSEGDIQGPNSIEFQQDVKQGFQQSTLHSVTVSLENR